MLLFLSTRNFFLVLILFFRIFHLAWTVFEVAIRNVITGLRYTLGVCRFTGICFFLWQVWEYVRFAWWLSMDFCAIPDWIWLQCYNIQIQNRKEKIHHVHPYATIEVLQMYLQHVRHKWKNRNEKSIHEQHEKEFTISSFRNGWMLFHPTHM